MKHTASPQSYAVDDVICWKCVDDKYLSAEIRGAGARSKCCLCGGVRKGVTIKDFAKILDPVIRDNFRHGPEVRRIGRGDDDSTWYEQEGDSLDWVIQTVTGQYFECGDAIEEGLQESEDFYPGDGGEPFYDSTTQYVETPVTLYGHYARWRDVQEELSHQRRFFSKLAKDFFDWLFEDVDNLLAPNVEGLPVPVVQELPFLTALYRARLCNSKGELSQMIYLDDPAVSLNAPPAEFARAGRMNADGVSVFYGAMDVETCVAELRPSIGAGVLVGQFRTTRPIRVLNFWSLDRAYWGEPLSYFQPGFQDLVERRQFLRRLHRLVTQPILPARESEYLITQTMAEYLAHVRTNRFDGLLFASAQRAGGTNIVLFPQPQSPDLLIDETPPFAVTFVHESASLHRLRKIVYEAYEQRFFIGGDGSAHIMSYDSDDDDPPWLAPNDDA